jgi:hypothetical protein
MGANTFSLDDGWNTLASADNGRDLVALRSVSMDSMLKALGVCATLEAL